MGEHQGSGFSIEAGGGEYTVSLKKFFSVLWRRLWVVLLVAALITGAIVGFNLTQQPVYSASAEILVGQRQSADSATSLTDLQGLQQLTLTAVEAVDSRRVAAAVVDDLGLNMDPDTLLAGMSVAQVTDTQFIQISYSDTDPQRAQAVANAVAEAASGQISEVSPDSSVTATVWEPAQVPEYPVSPDVPRNGILALMLGLLLGAALAFLLEYLDDSWRSPEEVEAIAGVPAFSMVPRFGEVKLRAKKK